MKDNVQIPCRNPKLVWCVVVPWELLGAKLAKHVQHKDQVNNTLL